MVFSGLTFLLYFLPIVLIAYFVRSGIRWRNGVLLTASIIFYAWGEPIWVLAMLASTLVNYLCAKKIARSRRKRIRKRWMALGVGASMALLFYFKYAAFFLNALLSVFTSYRITAPEMPIGISFFTFQIVTYTVDVYRQQVRAQKKFSSLLLYVCCFPQLIAGPIVKYSDVAAALRERTTTSDDFANGMCRFVAGLAKKVLLANLCGQAMEAMPAAGSLSVLGAWYGALLYTLQIYFDFSGYSDMAIGLGRIFGFEYKENFNYPYIAVSVRDFWRRWHISLGTFFREYVYIPLGGNRKGRGRTIFNTLVVWTLTGLWHGAGFSFILWGFYFGALLTIDLLGGRKVTDALPDALDRVITFVLVMIGWMIFYYPTVGEAAAHIGAMFGIGALGAMDAASLTVIKTYTLLPVIAFIAAMPVAPALQRTLGGTRLYSRLRIAALTVCLLLSICFIVGSSYNPFIYFRF